MLAQLLAAAAAAAPPPALPAFMTGCWDLAEGDHWTQECWMEPKAGLMLGASREGNGAKLASWEQLRIEQSADGTITLFASPGGRAPLPFAARTLSPSAIEFTNPAHDYLSASATISRTGGCWPKSRCSTAAGRCAGPTSRSGASRRSRQG